MALDFCIVGLGNPGSEYLSTRHNVGFLALDFLRDQWTFNDFSQNKYNQSMQTEGTLEGKKILLLKPQTFMNLSGNSLIKLRKDLKPSQFVILYDDFDLPFASIRIKAKGSPGTHNGMKSILNSLGTQAVPRVRIGIHPKHPISSAANFVLSPFSRVEIESLEPVLVNVRKSLEYLFSGELERAAREFNQKAL